MTQTPNRTDLITEIQNLLEQGTNLLKLYPTDKDNLCDFPKGPKHAITDPMRIYADGVHLTAANDIDQWWTTRNAAQLTQLVGTLQTGKQQWQTLKTIP